MHLLEMQNEEIKSEFFYWEIEQNLVSLCLTQELSMVWKWPFVDVSDSIVRYLF